MRTHKHDKKLLSTLVVLVLVAMACGTSSTGSEDQSSSSSDSSNLSATQAALEATQSALEAAQAEAEAQSAQQTADAETAAAAEQDKPTVEVEQQTEDEPPAYFLAEWDNPSELDSWAWLTTNGDDNAWDYYVENGKLVFDLEGESIWLYLFYEPWTYSDIRIDVEVHNVGANKNNVSLVCRESEYGWYEFNIGNDGLYSILMYEYDTDEYTLLYNGGAEEIRTGKDTNWYTAICVGNTLTLGVNGTEVRTITNNTFTDGYAAISVSSFDVLPVIVEYNWVEFSQP